MARFPSEGKRARDAETARERESPPIVDSIREGASGAATVAVGGSSFLVDLAQLESLGLPVSALIPGARLDAETLGLLELGAEAREAERRALALLARAEQSAFLLRGKLELRGFSKRAIGLALERLVEGGWLDDRRFARAYAASRLSRRAEGPTSLAAALRAKGIDADTAKSVIGELFDAEARQSALGAAYKRISRRYQDRETAREALQELGYKSSEISAFFESLDSRAESS